LLTTLGLGIGWTWAGPLYWGGFSWLTLHILLAVPLLILLLWHARRMRYQWRQPERAARRAFLRTAGMAAAALLLTPLARLGQSARRFTGSYETGSFTGRFPSVSWIADDPSPVDSARWRLQVTGAVAQAVNLSFEDMISISDARREATLDCTGGWYTDQIWQGVPLGVLLAFAEPLPTAQSVTVRSVTGYERRVSLDEAADAMLAMAVAGAPLSHGHGFPLRLVIPERRGFHWVKWVETIEVNETPAAWQPPVPLS
jgi:DMSO/TMAO reductase YedYZ molybdopterin-dependent catalytic subunit